jgi:hypothetical protein
MSYQLLTLLLQPSPCHRPANKKSKPFKHEGLHTNWSQSKTTNPVLRTNGLLSASKSGPQADEKTVDSDNEAMESLILHGYNADCDERAALSDRANTKATPFLIMVVDLR